MEEATMATTRRVSALPLPQAELDRLKETLAPYYGGMVWEGAGSRILVVRVPRAEPDLVNDIEQAVEYLSPADTQDLTAALLVGTGRTMAVATQPFADLMARRVQSDHQQGQELRRRIPSDTGHLVYRHPADPRKVLRLGLRVPHGSVSEVGDADLARWAEGLGPLQEQGRLSGVRAVHLVARNDDVRIDGDLFLQDLKERSKEERERRKMADALVAKQAERPAPPRVAYAPMRSPEPVPAAPTAPAVPVARPGSAGSTEHSAPADAGPPQPLAAAKARLEEAGFATRVRPKSQHPLDLAAERAEGEVQRVIVRTPERLTDDVARQILAAARALDVDLALVVCADADLSARKALIATKARWLRQEDLHQLHL
jgi:hypothetical protein